MIDARFRQSAFNRASLDQWEAFRPHRERMTRLLIEQGLAANQGRLCILGAGNCNDLDLRSLLDGCGALHLVDLDADAMEKGASRQGVVNDPRVTRHGGVDLTGMLDAISRWGPLTPINPADHGALARWPVERVAGALPGPFSVVASTCLLSQLIATVRHALGESRSDFMSIVQAVRLGHLRLLAALTAPGGVATLVADASSTDLVPEIADATDDALTSLLRRVDRENRVFHGSRPSAIQDQIGNDPWLGSRTRTARQVPPWRWRLHDRVYLVWALIIPREKSP